MPFQITFVINARQYLGKIFSKSDKNKNELTSATSDQNQQNIEANEIVNSEPQEFLSHLKSSDKFIEEKNYTPNVHTVNLDEELQSSVDEVIGKEKEVSKGYEKSKNYFKKLFSKKSSAISTEDRSSAISTDMFSKKQPTLSKDRFSDDKEATAVDTFSAILNSGQSLSTLVGKEFTLTTPVTVHAVENLGSSEPNILLKGTIPFKYATAEGIKKRNVHVSGRICKHSPKTCNSNSTLSKEFSTPSVSESSDRHSLTKIDIVRPKESLQFPVNWKTANIFQKHDYIVHCGLTKKKKNSDLDFKDKKKSKKKKSKKKAQKTHEEESQVLVKGSDVPITSITITRSRTRFITYNDGTEYIEKCGKETVTLKAPKGMYITEKGSKENLEEVDSEYVTQANALMVKSIHSNDQENPYTRDAYFFVRNGNSGLFPYDIFEQEYKVIRNAFVKNKFNIDTSTTENVSFTPKVSYPPNDYSEILEDKYNPLTWIYKSYNKTKNFVRGFSVQE